MQRVTSHSFVPAIARAYELIPAGLHKFIQPDFLCGTDPVFAGLHNFEDTSDGRSYRNTPHCAYPFNQGRLPKSQRRTTVVLPTPESVECVVHELGHVLHESLDFLPIARPVSWYAETNERESFAEAFTAWLIPGYAESQDTSINQQLSSLAA